jgi:Zn-dependent M28 family amino/carboxypeptidase
MRDLQIAAMVAAAALASAPPALAQGRDLAAGAAAVRDRALADDTAWRVVESLTTEVGPRPVGTPSMERARDWGVRTLTALGFENVHVEPFVTRAWIRGEEAAEVVAPYPQPLRILGLGGSAPTPKGGLSAEVVIFPTYQAMLDQPTGALKGKIALVTQRMSRTQDGSGYGDISPMRFKGAGEAAKRGAVAFLVRSLSTNDTRLPHAGYGGEAGIPAAALSVPDAELLERMAARGKPVVVRLSMASHIEPQATSWSVVGEIRGRERPDEVVLAGGHLDSWDPGTGAIDDGAGVAITTAAAKLAASGERPRRTLRVVMWGSEEQGGSGEAYAKAHAGEIGAIVVAGEADLGAGRVWRAALPAGAADHPAMQAFARAVTPIGVEVSREPARFGGSDLQASAAAGAPVAEFRQDATGYFDIHHSADDTLDKIDPKAMSQAVAVWASFLYAAAESDVDFRALKSKP